MNVELIVPIAMEEKLRFAIREGGRTVGAGVVARSSSNQTNRRSCPDWLRRGMGPAGSSHKKEQVV
jgi:hypothetical protein